MPLITAKDDGKVTSFTITPESWSACVTVTRQACLDGASALMNSLSLGELSPRDAGHLFLVTARTLSELYEAWERGVPQDGGRVLITMSSALVDVLRSALEAKQQSLMYHRENEEAFEVFSLLLDLPLPNDLTPEVSTQKGEEKAAESEQTGRRAWKATTE